MRADGLTKIENERKEDEVIDHVRTSFAFNLENVKVVIHVALLICSKLLSHPIFVSSVKQRTRYPTVSIGRNWGKVRLNFEKFQNFHFC